MIPGIDHEYGIYFEKLFDSSPEGVVIQGLDGIVLKANSTFCRMFGYTLDEVIGRDLDTLVGGDGDVRDEASSTPGRLSWVRSSPSNPSGRERTAPDFSWPLSAFPSR